MSILQNIDTCIENQEYDSAITKLRSVESSYQSVGSSAQGLTNLIAIFAGIRIMESNVPSTETNVETVVLNEATRINPMPLNVPSEASNKKLRIRLLCNWTTSESLCKTWNKMSKGDYTWNNIQIVWEEPSDYDVIINCPPINFFPDPKKTIVFRMEPNMEKNLQKWGEWGNPPEKDFVFVGYHDKHYNNNEWHLSKTFTQLCTEKVVKDTDYDNIMSTVLSDKYQDSGHIKRVDFIKFLESKEMQVHVYGGNKFDWVDYKGSLPYHEKDDALFPYKYTFNVENQPVNGYFSEKLIDGILSECLVFYSGCPDIREYIDERAFVWLELSNFEADYIKIKEVIRENLWYERLPYIKEAKKKILNEMQFFPRIEKIIENHEQKL